MTEENKEAPVETPVEAQPSEAEQKALEQGWVPKDQWQGDPNEWRPAKEFVERGELFKHIHTMKRELKQTQAAHDAQVRHHQFVFEKAYQKAMKDLRDEKRQAIRAQDFEAIEKVEAKMEELQVEKTQEAQSLVAAQQVAAQQPVDPVFQNWVGKNQWYLSDADLNVEADLIGRRFIMDGGDRTQLFSHVERKIKEKYPEKFGRKVAAPNAVASPDRSGGKKPTGGNTLSDLPPEMREVVKNFTAVSGMSEAEYIKQLKDIGAI